MKPIYLVGLIVLALTLVFAVVGMLLVGAKKINLQKAASYCRWSTLLVLAAGYGLTQYDWPGVQLRQVDFWSLLVILAIAAYALIWGALAYQFNKTGHEEFGESFMLSMLFSDSEQPTQVMPQDKKTGK